MTTKLQVRPSSNIYWHFMLQILMVINSKFKFWALLVQKVGITFCTCLWAFVGSTLHTSGHFSTFCISAVNFYKLTYILLFVIADFVNQYTPSFFGFAFFLLHIFGFFENLKNHEFFNIPNNFLPEVRLSRGEEA